MTGHCSGLLSVAVLKQTQKKSVYHITQIRVCHQGKPGQEPGGRNRSRAGGTLLTGLLPLLVLSLLSYIIQVHLLADGTTHNELSPLTSIIPE